MPSSEPFSSLPPILHALPQDAVALAVDRGLGANVSLVGTDLRIHYVNDGFAKSFATSPESIIGKLVTDFYAPQHFQAFEPYMRRAFAGESVRYERRTPVVGSDDIWYTVSFTPWRNPAGEVIGLISCSMKVHELKLTFEELRVAKERLSSHMENSPLAVLELDEALRVTHCSARVTAMLGLAPQALIGQPLLQALAITDTNAPLALAFERLRAGVESNNRAESALSHTDGHSVHCDWFNSALTDASGQVRSIMALVQDVSAREEAARQLLHIATHDPLTGLANRRMLTDRLSHSLERAQRTGEPVALLFIDLDGFKRVNDVFGHNAGDEVLKTVAARLKSAARASDFIARLGGDEFVILMDASVTEVAPSQLSERIFATLAAPCEFEGGAGQVGASIGVAMHPPLSHLAADLIRRADAAMYDAKTAGKGCVRYATA